MGDTGRGLAAGDGGGRTDAGAAAPAGRATSDPSGLLLIVLSALCYSTLGIFGKVAIGEGMDLPSLLATRFVLGAAILWGVVLASPHLRAEAGRVRGRRAGLLFWGVMGFAGQSTLFFSALRFISASLTEVLLYTCPAFLAIILWMRTGRRPSGPVLLAIVLALSGAWLAGAPIAGAQVNAAGVALAVGGGLYYAGFLLVLDRVTPGVPAFISTTWIVTGAAAVFAGALPFSGGYVPPPTRAAWGAVLGLVAGSTILGFFLFVIGLKRVGPQVAAILSTFEPIGTLFLAMLFLGERLGAAQWAGAALVLGAAFVLAALSGRDAAPLPAPAPAAPAPD